MSRKSGPIRIRVFSIVTTMTIILGASTVGGNPVALVNRGTTLYRFNANGNGLIESFPNQLGTAIGLTTVPMGVSVTGCVAGDVLAVEPGGGGNFWRVDGASCGVPTLISVGNVPAGIGLASIAFAHGELYGIGSGARLFKFNPATFTQIGNAIDLSSDITGVGGLAFDGVATWYVLDSGSDSLYRCPDPPTANSLQLVGNAGVAINDNGLEYFNGQLWGATVYSPGVHVGTFDLQTGAFTPVWNQSPISGNNLGITVLPERASIVGDINCDNHVNGLDIAPFVLAITNPSGFAAAFPACSILNADLSNDCLVNMNDIQAFVNALLNS